MVAGGVDLIDWRLLSDLPHDYSHYFPIADGNDLVAYLRRRPLVDVRIGQLRVAPKRRHRDPIGHGGLPFQVARATLRARGGDF
jgi:hypothetical protein